MTVQHVINTITSHLQMEIYEEIFCEVTYIGTCFDVPEKFRNCPVICMDVTKTGALRLYIS